MAIFGYLGTDSLCLHMYKYQWISRYSSVVGSIIQFIYMSFDLEVLWDEGKEYIQLVVP